jgi:hypothetical protein
MDKFNALNPDFNVNIYKIKNMTDEDKIDTFNTLINTIEELKCAKSTHAGLCLEAILQYKIRKLNL